MKDYRSKYLPDYVYEDNVEFSETEIKSSFIVRKLFDYDVCNARDAVRVIEEHGVDKFDFDYPYGSFEEYKKHVLAGEFDADVKSCMTTPEQKRELKRLIETGKLKISY